MSVEIAWKQNNLVTDFPLLKLLLVVFGFGLQAFICEFSRQNICSVQKHNKQKFLITDFNLLKSLQVEFGFGLQAFICEFNRQNICSVLLFEPINNKLPRLKPSSSNHSTPIYNNLYTSLVIFQWHMNCYMYKKLNY